MNLPGHIPGKHYTASLNLLLGARRARYFPGTATTHRLAAFTEVAWALRERRYGLDEKPPDYWPCKL